MPQATPEAWKTIQLLSPALIAFVGVCVGAFLSAALAMIKDYVVERRRAGKDAAYLAAIVGGELDKFVNACSDVVHDEGEDDDNGYTHVQVNTPNFTPSMFQVEWRSIPQDIMFQILDLPYQIRAANGRIGDVNHYEDTPPDYSLTFEERQLQFSVLGLHAMEIVKNLRSHTGLTPRASAERWDPSSKFRSTIAKAHETRAARAKANQDFIDSVSGGPNPPVTFPEN